MDRGNKMKIMVSACLLGTNCKYDGGNNDSRILREFVKGHEIVPVCPEVLGGLPIPRIPAEIVNGRVINREGGSVDEAFRKGAEICLEKAREEGIDLAVLQPRSPSCGVRSVYDGTFSGRLTGGSGIFARLLMENGFRVVDAEEFASGAER